MSNPKHTPLDRLKHHVTGAIERGPWTSVEQQNGSVQIQASLKTVATIEPRALNTYRANARLIAAAPELLDALDFAVKELEALGANPRTLAYIDTAIAKATGGAE